MTPKKRQPRLRCHLCHEQSSVASGVIVTISVKRRWQTWRQVPGETGTAIERLTHTRRAMFVCDNCRLAICLQVPPPRYGPDLRPLRALACDTYRLGWPVKEATS